jgi:hypothetical protein
LPEEAVLEKYLQNLQINLEDKRMDGSGWTKAFLFFVRARKKKVMVKTVFMDLNPVFIKPTFF